jgi:hypothetical protein
MFKARYVSVVCAILSVVSAGAVHAQTAQEIVDKHVAAIGGRALLDSIRTLRIEGALATEGDVSGATSLISPPAEEKKVNISLVNCKKFCKRITYGTQLYVTCHTGAASWTIDGSGDGKAKPMDAQWTDAVQAQTAVDGPLANHAQLGASLALRGREKIDGVEAFNLILTTKGGTEFTYLIHPDTYHVLKRVIRSKGGDHVETELYSDYRKTESGLVVSYARKFQVAKSGLMYLVVEKVQVDTDLDPALFEMPS